MRRTERKGSDSVSRSSSVVEIAIVGGIRVTWMF